MGGELLSACGRKVNVDVQGFEQPGFDDSGWDDIPVPANWQLQGDIARGEYCYDFQVRFAPVTQ